MTHTFKSQRLEDMSSDDQLEAAASIVAQQKAMERSCVWLSHGSRLFSVQSGWEAEMISRDPAIISCDTLLSLETAVRDEGVRVIFIPKDSLIAASDIERIIQRNGALKTLFQETED